MATIAGEQAIGTLKAGEHVWAYNTQTKQMEYEPIVHVWVTHDNDLVDLTLTSKTVAPSGKHAHQSSETVHTNKKHPFLTLEKGFLPVAQLKLGMHVVEAGGRVGEVTGWKSVPGAQTMYNLEVTQDHTYTVGDGQFIVHNCGGSVLPEPENLTFDNHQIGKKWGSHYKDYPNMQSYDEYRAKAQEIFDNSDKVSYNPNQNGGKFHYTQGNDLVIVTKDGRFESLYPGAHTPVVLKGIRVS